MVARITSGQLFNKIVGFKESTNGLTRRCAATSSSSRSAEAVFLEKTLEHPIIAVTDRDNVDMIGPPDPLSNLRPIVRRQFLHETELQQKLRLLQDRTHEWNQKFWAEHNVKFIQQRKDYVKIRLAEMNEDRNLTADEMSEFYKQFLDDNWEAHVTYNIEWYKRNFRLLFLSLRASLPQSLHFM